MRFYERTLGGKLELMLKSSEAPPGAGCPGASPDAILHACVEIQGRKLMASDWMGDQPYPGQEWLLAVGGRPDGRRGATANRMTSAWTGRTGCC